MTWRSERPFTDVHDASAWQPAREAELIHRAGAKSGKSASQGAQERVPKSALSPTFATRR
jgi:hypothetical protein